MPKVHKNILVLLAGILWSAVGLFLICQAFGWFAIITKNEMLLDIFAGLIIGAVIAYFGFIGLANKNISRINLYNEKVCVWAFQKWQSYLLIAFMMSLGIFLRDSSLPKFMLAPIYIGIGSALFIASFRYYIFLFNTKRPLNA